MLRQFALPATRTVEPVRDAAGMVAGLIVRTQEPLECWIEASLEQPQDGLFRIGIRISNHTPFGSAPAAGREGVLARSLLSTHSILRVRDGEFVSLLEPPQQFRDAAACDCRSMGAWPVLAGEAGRHDTVLCSPIILYDYPQIAPESPGDLFDGAEIDEILSLRILTLTDEEKSAMRRSDERARRILERTEALPPEHFMKLHGALRAPASGRQGGVMNEWEWQLLEDKTPLDSVLFAGVALRAGDTVRLRPRAGGDIFDMALSGKTAIVESIEQDYEGNPYLAVVLNDDPGRDLGLLRQPGHRFFFSPAEVEPAERRRRGLKILIAGIGNIFFGDDAFGVEVANCLSRRTLPAEARVVDFGIRGFDLGLRPARRLRRHHSGRCGSARRTAGHALHHGDRCRRPGQLGSLAHVAAV